MMTLRAVVKYLSKSDTLRQPFLEERSARLQADSLLILKK